MQDETIIEFLGGKKNGYFIDLAAADAVILSNTLMLERDYNWTGLCIDANLKYLKTFMGRRCQFINAVVGARDGEIVSFDLETNPFYGGVVGDQFDNKNASQHREEVAGEVREMRTVSLQTLFRDFNVPATIDYMSLDIEGAEAWVFSTFPWDAYTFLTMTIERPKPELQALLRARNYTYVLTHGTFGDQLWIHRSLPAFDRIVATFATQEMRALFASIPNADAEDPRGRRQVLIALIAPHCASWLIASYCALSPLIAPHRARPRLRASSRTSRPRRRAQGAPGPRP